MTEDTTKPLNEIYAVFCGVIDQDALKRLFQGITAAMANKIERAHLLFQSAGGLVSDGVCLYNFLRSLSMELVLYNVGSVQSIATIAYLGASKRKTSARATFMIHRTNVSPQFATAARLKRITQSVSLDDIRTEAILREHLKMSEELWADLNHDNLLFSAEEAVQVGIAHEIGEFAPPKGVQIFNV